MTPQELVDKHDHVVLWQLLVDTDRRRVWAGWAEGADLVVVTDLALTLVEVLPRAQLETTPEFYDTVVEKAMAGGYWVGR